MMPAGLRKLAFALLAGFAITTLANAQAPYKNEIHHHYR
jgi:hypothetical protein